jgi:hypothetical protein
MDWVDSMRVLIVRDGLVSSEGFTELLGFLRLD